LNKNENLVDIKAHLVSGDADKSENRVDVVFIGDGFSQEDMDSGDYRKEVQRVIDGFLAFSPF